VKTTAFPVDDQAAAGGGGHGIRIARSAESFIISCRRRGRGPRGFGDGGLYVEKLSKVRAHRGAVLGDGRDVIHCFERECSLSAPSKGLGRSSLALADVSRSREAISSARPLAKAVHYRGAGRSNSVR